jgi:hypothetical protein
MSGGGSKPGERRGGRKHGTRNKRTLETLSLLADGESPCAFALNLMGDTEQPIKVRLEAAKIAAPYIHPRPQPERRLVQFELPPDIASAAAIAQVHTTLLRAVAAGELAVDEAKEISIIIETHRRTIETVELEARIARLENARATGSDQSGAADVHN